LITADAHYSKIRPSTVKSLQVPRSRLVWFSLFRVCLFFCIYEHKALHHPFTAPNTEIWMIYHQLAPWLMTWFTMVWRYILFPSFSVYNCTYKPTLHISLISFSHMMHPKVHSNCSYSCFLFVILLNKFSHLHTDAILIQLVLQKKKD
jgi:hypothetical protein